MQTKIRLTLPPKSNPMNTTLYGFSSANHSDEPAWFHSETAAARFAVSCGWENATIETADLATISPSDILDTPEKPWGDPEPIRLVLPGRLSEIERRLRAAFAQDAANNDCPFEEWVAALAQSYDGTGSEQDAKAFLAAL